MNDHVQSPVALHNISDDRFDLSGLGDIHLVNVDSRPRLSHGFDSLALCVVWRGATDERQGCAGSDQAFSQRQANAAEAAADQINAFL